MPQAARLERLLDGEEGFGDDRLVGHRKEPAFLALPELRAGLDGELVAGEVTQSRRGERLGLGSSIVRRLIRQAEDEIRRDARDAGAERSFDGAPRPVGIVEASEKP
jgi:hypothetical protein